MKRVFILLFLVFLSACASVESSDVNLAAEFKEFNTSVASANSVTPVASIDEGSDSLDDVFDIIDDSDIGGIIADIDTINTSDANKTKNIAEQEEFPIIKEELSSIPGCFSAFFKGSSYLFCGDSLSWEDARDSCKSIGWNLAAINSEEESVWLGESMISTSFIGFNYLELEDSFVWTGDSSNNFTNFTNWAKGEPNNYHDEDCVVVIEGGQWLDVPCSLHHRYVCEN